MTKILIFFFTLLLIFTACKKKQGNDAQNNEDNQSSGNQNNTSEDYRIYSKIPDNWQDMKFFVAQIELEKLVYFIGKATASDLQAAKETAILNAQANAAKAIKEITIKQIRVIKKKNPNSLSEEIFKTIETKLSENVDISGLINAKNHYVETNQGVTFTVLMAIDYTLFVQKRRQALSEIAENQYLKNETVSEINTALSKFDESNNFFLGRQR